MSKWDEWKKNLGETRPWHILDQNKLADNPKTAEERLEICTACPELIKLTSQCKKCGCIMSIKTKLEAAKCPIGKW
jgi:hypothetical protein